MRLNRGYLALGPILLATIIGLAVPNGFGAAPDADRASSAKEDDIIKGLRVNDLRILAAEKLDEQTKTRVYRCLTKYKGQPVHLQWINGPESIKEAAQRGESQQRDQLNNLNLDDFQQVEPQRGNRSNENPEPQKQQRQRSD